MNKIHKKISQFISPIYLVGGAVRDELIGIKTKDLDFTTPIEPSQVEQLLNENNYKTYIIGKRFDTIGTFFKDYDVQITTFRCEQYLKFSRKPKVQFGFDLQEDLMRRDFTINAMALDPQGQLIDPFFGCRDIEAKIIRSIGDPKIKFDEDPLRMLRAARFCSQLCFDVDKKTILAMKKKKELLLLVSKERWMMEMDKLLTGKNIAKALALLNEIGLLQIMFKGFLLKKKIEFKDISFSVDTDRQWAKLIKGVVISRELSPEYLTKIALHFKWSKKRRKKVLTILNCEGILCL